MADAEGLGDVEDFEEANQDATDDEATEVEEDDDKETEDAEDLDEVGSNIAWTIALGQSATRYAMGL